MDISKTAKLADNYLKLAKKYNAPRKGMKSRWSTKYKRNIDCSNPKGFSQKAYCARKRRGGSYKSDVNDLEWLDEAVTKFRETANAITDSVLNKIEELKKSYWDKKTSPTEIQQNIDKIKWEGQEKIHELAQKAKAEEIPDKHIDKAQQRASGKIDQHTEKFQQKLEMDIDKLNKEIETSISKGVTPEIKDQSYGFNPEKPLRGSYFSSGGFGQVSSKKFHKGVDLRPASGEGTPIYAIENGVVTKVTTESGNPAGGNAVVIKHNDGIHTSYYAHMKDVNVKVGDIVTKDTIIGTVGNTGNHAKHTLPHLHLQISENDSVQDPSKYIYVPPYTDYDPKKETPWQNA